jgi:hypothetical protein
MENINFYKPPSAIASFLVSSGGSDSERMTVMLRAQTMLLAKTVNVQLKNSGVP